MNSARRCGRSDSSTGPSSGSSSGVVISWRAVSRAFRGARRRGGSMGSNIRRMNAEQGDRPQRLADDRQRESRIETRHGSVAGTGLDVRPERRARRRPGRTLAGAVRGLRPRAAGVGGRPPGARSRAAAAYNSSSLSARSSTSCSAFFRPTRGTLCSVAMSRSRMAGPAGRRRAIDRRLSASAGPTPLAASTARNTWRSYGVENPKSCHASSRTTRCVCRVTGSPSSPQRLEYGQRDGDVVCHPALGHDFRAIDLFGYQAANDLADHARAMLGDETHRGQAESGPSRQ